MTDTELGLTVGEAAAKVGLTTYTLRWYEQEGLLPAVPRDAAGRRRYRRSDLDRLDLLVRLRATGMPVSDMRRYATLARAGDATVGERARLFEAHRDRVLERIADLRRDLEIVDRKIAWYRASAARLADGGEQ